MDAAALKAMLCQQAQVQDRMMRLLQALSLSISYTSRRSLPQP